MMTTSDELRAWRSARRWTQQQAADAFGYSLRAYAEYEKPAKAVPKLLALAVIAYEAISVTKPQHCLTDFNNSSDPAHCFMQYDMLNLLPRGAERTLALIAWAERWGDALTNALRFQKAPKGHS